MSFYDFSTKNKKQAKTKATLSRAKIKLDRF